MAETKTAPVETDDPDEGELATLAESIRGFDEAAIRAALEADGVSKATIDLLVGQQRQTNETNKRLLQLRERDRTNSYMGSLREQFPYAFDEDNKPLFSGTSRNELRRNAEKLHNRTASLVGATKKEETKTAEETAARARTAAGDQRAEEWGQPPAASGEVITDRPDLGWGEQKRTALRDSGNSRVDESDLKARVFDDLKRNGPREVDRKSIGQILGRNAIAAQRKSQGKSA